MLLFRDPAAEPTCESLEEALGVAYPAYAAFLEKLAAQDITLTWRYYTDVGVWLAKGRYTWTGPRGGQKEVTVFGLSVWEDFFKVTVYLSENARAAVLGLPLGEAALQCVAMTDSARKRKTFPVTFDLRSAKLFKDVFTLIDFKKLWK